MQALTLLTNTQPALLLISPSAPITYRLQPEATGDIQYFVNSNEVLYHRRVEWR
jgi:hypothetical protein